MSVEFRIADYPIDQSSVKALMTDMESLYQDLAVQQAALREPGQCAACGKCCDFEVFGHKLYLTTPELLYFVHSFSGPFERMTEGVCPYRWEGKCSVYPFRFVGCRIFQCKGSAAAQNELTETMIARLKQLCAQYDVPYYYVDLKTAMTWATRY